MKPRERLEVVLPELGMQAIPVVVSQWLVTPGKIVVQGDRLVELLAGSASVDLPAPASGVLKEVFVQPGQQVQPGQPLGWIEVEP